MDSLGGSRARNVQRLKRFLVAEAKHRFARACDVRRARGHVVRVPLQPNTTDCGLFLLQTMEEIVRDYSCYFGDSQRVAKLDMAGAYQPRFAMDRRERLRRVMEEMQEQWEMEMSNRPQSAHPQSMSSDVEEVFMIERTS